MANLQRIRTIAWGLCLAITLAGTMRAETLVAGQRVRLNIPVPAGYSYSVDQGGEDVVAVELENPVWQITLRMFISGDVPVDAAKAQWQRDVVVRNSSHFLSDSREQDYRWQTLYPDEGTGQYCVFSDAVAKKASELEPGSYLHVVTGIKVIRGAAMYFQIWCNDLKSPEYEEIFNLVLHHFDRQ